MINGHFDIPFHYPRRLCKHFRFHPPMFMYKQLNLQDPPFATVFRDYLIYSLIPSYSSFINSAPPSLRRDGSPRRNPLRTENSGWDDLTTYHFQKLAKSKSIKYTNERFSRVPVLKAHPLSLAPSLYVSIRRRAHQIVHDGINLLARSSFCVVTEYFKQLVKLSSKCWRPNVSEL